MPHVISQDGSTIAFETAGQGPLILLVDGALSYRQHHGGRPLAAALATEFTVVVYDRRGRGESSDARPYAVERETEDIAALIAEVGGPVSLYGFSSGAVLALKAAARLGDRVASLALHAPPITLGDAAIPEFAAYRQRMDELLAANQRDAAVAFFLADMLPADVLEQVRQSPNWALMAAVAPTLAHDNAVLGDGGLPLEDARAATMPALILDSDASPGFIREAADALAGIMPRARRITLSSPSHQIAPETLAPILGLFFRNPENALPVGNDLMMNGAGATTC